ncbi:flagellar basal-body MS-ring/collar protein FliF [Roseicyclus sp.]|uniref:flagellar basal-body MS-ring/collar protein FliF n=1 Tax=Roseicyclus sp. TaxID=1914329 RepID=UPI0026379789|nr:flagellar basal-body MS-ring/collar protein FliF [Roseicyclus sp.]
MAETTQPTQMTRGAVGAGSGLVPSGGNMLASVRNVTSQPGFQRAMPTIVAALAVVMGLAAYLYMLEPARTTLYASLSEADKAAVVDSLTNSGIEVTLDPVTGDVLVPVGDYHRSRMSLAAQGLPTSAPEGYAALGDIPMGTSRSVETVRLKQAQEIELARSINEISVVQAARVHLALPERSAFVRHQEAPTASVFLQLASGRRLDEGQVEAIVNLVSTSVTGMARENVTIIDQTGRLLSKSLDDPASILTDSQLQYRMRLEGIYRSRIESLVTPIVGPGNVNAQVNIEIDFTRNEVTEERVDPDGTALRSEQNTLDVAANAEARGVPGATANTAPTEAEIADRQAANPGGAGQSENRSSSEVRNYEVSRRVSTTMSPTNRIVKIDAALLLRTQMVTDPETGIAQPQNMSPETLADIERLVSSAIGLNLTRGDNITVTAQPFISTLEGVSVDWFQTDWVENLAKQIVTVLLLAVITLGVIRPLLNRVLVPSGGGAMVGGMTEQEADALESVEVAEGESLEDIKAKLKPKKSNISLEMLDTANTYDDKVAIIRMIVGDEAGRVSNVFKQMMKKELDQKA